MRCARAGSPPGEHVLDEPRDENGVQAAEDVKVSTRVVVRGGRRDPERRVADAIPPEFAGGGDVLENVGFVRER